MDCLVFEIDGFAGFDGLGAAAFGDSVAAVADLGACGLDASVLLVVVFAGGVSADFGGSVFEDFVFWRSFAMGWDS